MKIELRRAAMTYQAPDGEVAALQDVTFGVADGEFVSIVGPSGCGKTTFLKTLNGLYQLAGFARKLPNQLSGGMRQRCALIRTLATSPDVLLLDEPFSALDYQTRLAVSGDISQIIRREHKTALLVTHDISEAISLSDRIVVLSHRPATVKAIHDLGALRTVPPLERRSRPEFQALFNQIWEELDVNV